MGTDTSLRLVVAEVVVDPKGSKSRSLTPGPGTTATIICQSSESSRKTYISSTYLEQLFLPQQAYPPVKPRDRVSIYVCVDDSGSRRKINAYVASVPTGDIALSQEDYRRIFSDKPGRAHFHRPQSPVPSSAASGSRTRTSQRRHRVPKSTRGAASYDNYQGDTHSTAGYPGLPSPPPTTQADSLYEYQQSEHGNSWTTSQDQDQWTAQQYHGYGHHQPSGTHEYEPSNTGYTNFPPETPFPDCPDYEDDTAEARRFWKWDVREQKWKHENTQTGEVVFCPDELD